MESKKRNAVDAVLNLVIILSTIIAVGLYFVSGPDALGSSGTRCFRYFTTDSNVLAAVAALVMLVYNVRGTKPPKWATVFKFVGTVSVTVTLLTVVFFLAPMGALHGGLRGYLRFFEDSTFALHFSTPVVAIVSLLFERYYKLTFADTLWGLAPTVVYSLVYLVLVVFIKVWTDWYGFTFGGKLYMAPVSMAGMYLVTLGIASILRKFMTARKG